MTTGASGTRQALGVFAGLTIGAMVTTVVAIPLGWSIEPRIDWEPDVVVLRFEPGGEIRVPMTMMVDSR